METIAAEIVEEITAKEYFKSQAVYNPWLRELTIEQRTHIIDMLTQFKKVKQTMIINFHYAGIVCKEEWDIINEDDKTVTLGDALNPNDEWKFDKKTGKCLNDNTDFGAYRTIKPIVEKAI